MRRNELCHSAIHVLAAAMLAACGKSSPGPQAPAAAIPSDPALARIYDQTCRACHANPASGAPQAGDRAAWAPRVAQGMDVLLDHTINGYKGMPPLGTCGDCSEDELRALIRFMSEAHG